VEAKPWHLTNLTLFTASSPSQSASYITFTFTDPNPGLKLSTTCTRQLEPVANPDPYSNTSTTTSATNPSIPTPSPQSLVVVGGSANENADPLADATTWYPCANSTVRFQYAGVGKKITVQRSYRDPAVGEAPWDVVTAFGTSGKAVEGKVVKGQIGVVRTVREMEVKVTNVIA